MTMTVENIYEAEMGNPDEPQTMMAIANVVEQDGVAQIVDLYDVCCTLQEKADASGDVAHLQAFTDVLTRLHDAQAAIVTAAALARDYARREA